MKTEKKRLGELLIEAGFIDELQLNSALGQQKQWGGRLGSKLIEIGFINEQSLASVLEKQLGEKCISLEDKEIPQNAITTVKVEIAKKYCIMPLDLDKNTLSVAMPDPTDMKTIDDLTFMLGVRIKPVLALESDIKSAIAMHYEGIAIGGRTYKAAMEKINETMQTLKSESQTPTSPQEILERLPEKKELTSKTIIEAIIALLIEKKIISREELAKKIDEKSKKG